MLLNLFEYHWVEDIDDATFLSNAEEAKPAELNSLSI